MKNLKNISLSDIPGSDDTHREELENGIVVLARPNFQSPSVTVHGYLPVGSIFDSEEKLGLADFTASMLMRGTQQHSFHQIYESLEEVGAGFGFSGGTHTAGLAGRCLVEDLPLVMRLLGETLRQPTFPERQVEKIRAALLTSLDLREQDTHDRAGLAFDAVVYRNHPYGRPDEGYPKTIKAITPEDIRQFHRRHYGPRGLVLAIVGGIEPKEAVNMVAESLGDWENPSQPEPPELPEWQPLPGVQRVFEYVEDKSESEVLVGTAGPSRSAPDFSAAAVGNMILGKFGMMGRIGEVLREQAGLAYYASSGLGSSLGPGAWTVSAGVPPQEAEHAIDLIFEVLKEFVTEPVTPEELKDVQDNLIGSLPLSLESNGGVASRLLYMERHDLGLDYLRGYPAAVRAITREEILGAAAKYLDLERMAVVVAGSQGFSEESEDER